MEAFGWNDSRSFSNTPGFREGILSRRGFRTAAGFTGDRR
jgi:hypothetical protein